MKKIIGLVALVVVLALVAWGMNNSKKGESMEGPVEVAEQNEVMEEKTEEVMEEVKEPVADGSYTVAVEDSLAQWTGSKKLLVDWVDSGTIGVKEGNVSVESGKMVSGSIVFDMASISAQKTGMGEEAAPNLSKHLMSADFFDVENYPTATFEIVEVVPGEFEHTFTANGKLTIKDVTNDISVPVVAYMQQGTLIVEGDAVVDRTLWNVKYGSDKFFDNLANNVINDEFKLKFELMAQAV